MSIGTAAPFISANIVAALEVDVRCDETTSAKDVLVLVLLKIGAGEHTATDRKQPRRAKWWHARASSAKQSKDHGADGSLFQTRRIAECPLHRFRQSAARAGPTL
jgi:hypothetical protein